MPTAPARSPHERWLVEHNPLYLLSAALVLTGCTLLLRGLASDDGDGATIAIGLLSEAYAFALALGAALLVRIGLRRPATMLALLFVLYQWDLTLFTETCALHGHAGSLRAIVWLAIFAAKVPLLEWALRLRIAPRMIAAWGVAGAGLVMGPAWLPELGHRAAGVALAAWLFTLAALYRGGTVESRDELSPWGRTVLARCTRAAWALSGLVIGAHVLLWAKDHAIDPHTAVLAAPLAFVRGVRREGRAWALAGTTALFVACVHPGGLAITALLAGIALLLRAYAPAFDGEPAPSPATYAAAEGPYRWTPATDGASAPARAPIAAEPVVDVAERARGLIGAILGAYVATWTAGWTRGPCPQHVLVLDLALAAALVLVAWRLHARAAAAIPLATSYAHLLITSGLVTAPRTATQWGASSVTLGFALLAGSLAVSYRLRRGRPAGTAEATSGAG